MCEQLAQGCYLTVLRAPSRSGDLSVTSSARYRYITKPHPQAIGGLKNSVLPVAAGEKVGGTNG